MGDQQVAHRELRLQVFEQIHNLRLDGDIQRRYWFVKNDQLRAQCNGSSHGNTLTLTPAEFVREHVGVPRMEADLLEQLGHSLLELLSGKMSIDDQGLGNDCAHSHAGIQRAPGILEHCLRGGPVAPQRLALQPVYVGALKVETARSGSLQQQQHAGGRGLAAARFPDKRQRFLLVDVE